MQREATILRAFQACLAVGGSFALFALLDLALAVTGVYPWADAATATARLVLAAALAGLAFALGALVWRQREDRHLGGATFADAVLIGGAMLVGAVLLLAVLH